MTLKEKIKNDLNNALKERKEIELATLRMLNAAIVNKEKEKRNKISKEEKELTEEKLIKKSQLIDEEIIEVISSEVKKRKEAIIEFKKGGRKDLADKEKKEMEVLVEYLPEQMPEEEVKKLVKEAIDKINAKEIKDIRTSPSARTLNASRILGKVMAELMPKIKGKADASLVSKIVKESLGSVK